jgi:hypothetical protein
MSENKNGQYLAHETKEIKNYWRDEVKKDEVDKVEKKKVKYPPLPNGLSSNRPH